jgi:hypothetical protein
MASWEIGIETLTPDCARHAVVAMWCGEREEGMWTAFLVMVVGTGDEGRRVMENERGRGGSRGGSPGRGNGIGNAWVSNQQAKPRQKLARARTMFVILD